MQILRVRVIRRGATVASAILCAALLTACGASTLKTSDFDTKGNFIISDDAKIPDTEENRAVLTTVDAYRVAMNERDITKLRSLVASSYYENASSTDDTTDDYGNEKLEELFSDYLGDAVKEVRYEMEVQRLTKENDQVHVDYSYIWSFRYTSDGRDHWKPGHDVNRLTLVQEDGSWKIAAGL